MPGWRRAEPPHASHQERPLSAHAIFVSDEPGSVASWTCEIFDETGTDRIGDVHEDDWDGAGRLHYRTNRRTANRHDYIRCKCNQFPPRHGFAGVSEARTVVDVQTPRCREAPRPPAASSDHLICERGGPSTAVPNVRRSLSPIVTLGKWLLTDPALDPRPRLLPPHDVPAAG